MARIGIDLGTTNSLIALFDGEKPQLIKNALGSYLTPSVVSLTDDGEILVGAPAKERLLTHPNRSAASFKRFMGSAHTLTLGGKPFRPEELSAFVLRSLKADAEADIGTPVTKAVISVPAYFNDPQRKATINAARLAELDVDRLVNEPTAAALAYGLGETPEGKYLIFDLGGGTFDVSILERYADVFEIKATTGDLRLGGDDFTAMLQTLLCKRCGLTLSKLNAGETAILARQAERLKLALSIGHEAAYSFNLGSRKHAGELTRAEFEEASSTLLRRLRQPTERAVRDSSVAASEFDAVVLVGGATRMPMVRSLVGRMFGRLPIATLDPDTTVALGAAVQAGLAGRSGVLRDVVMTDVCPHTLGIASVDDPDDPVMTLSVHPIIERNATVPISRSSLFSTVQNRQKQIAVQVYQGENFRPEHNIHLGTIDVPVPSRPKGEEAVEVRFTYDLNGALQVEAKVISTGKTYERFFLNPSGLDDVALEKRFAELAKIKLHPREQAENQALLAKAERLYEEHRGIARDEIRELIRQFMAEISVQQMRKPEACRDWFDKALSRYEDPQLAGD